MQIFILIKLRSSFKMNFKLNVLTIVNVFILFYENTYIFSLEDTGLIIKDCNIS